VAVLLGLLSGGLQAQTFQLLFETFDAGPSAFSLNTADLGGTTGPNTWIINDEYLGGGVYPRPSILRRPATTCTSTTAVLQARKMRITIPPPPPMPLRPWTGAIARWA
jgi:hypothetical protein